MPFKLMSRRKGFTLIEVVIALSTLLIVGSFFYQGRTNLLRRPQMDLPTVDWYLMLRELENPDHHFAVTDVHTSRRVGLVAQKSGGKYYYLVFSVKSGLLRLESKHGGMIVMMRHVRQFHFGLDHVMTVTTTRGETYTAKLLIPDEGRVTDETAIGNHSAIGN